MNEYTARQLAAMRRRWRQRYAERLATPPATVSVERLHELALADLERRRDGHAQQARDKRQRQAEAKTHGADDIARSLGMLAVYHEQAATLAEAERRDRIARHERFRRAEKNREHARKSRPGRRSPLADRIKVALAPFKREGVAFKLVLRSWERDRIGSLRLTELEDGRYLVSDEDGADDAEQPYTLGTLAKLYSKSTAKAR